MKSLLFALAAAITLTVFSAAGFAAPQGTLPPTPAPSNFTVADDDVTRIIHGFSTTKDIVIDNDGPDEVTAVIRDASGNFVEAFVVGESGVGFDVPADHTVDLQDGTVNPETGSASDDGDSDGSSGTWQIV